MSKDLTVMYVSGEESEGKIKGEFRRTVFKLFPHAKHNVLIASANNPESIVAEAHKLNVDVLIIDSLSHLQSHKVQGAMGKEVQMKHAAEILMDAAHGINTSAGMKPMIVIVIVHATKGLDMAGANAVKHVIDGAFFMEHIDPMTLQPVDDQNVTTGYIRIRAHGKYRAGSTDRVGYYRMTDKGLKAYHPKKPVASAKGKKGARTLNTRAPNPKDRAVTKKGAVRVRVR
jgi:predicted ATP-dependent serine protease